MTFELVMHIFSQGTVLWRAGDCFLSIINISYRGGECLKPQHISLERGGGLGGQKVAKNIMDDP